MIKTIKKILVSMFGLIALLAIIFYLGLFPSLNIELVKFLNSNRELFHPDPKEKIVIPDHLLCESIEATYLGLSLDLFVNNGAQRVIECVYKKNGPHRALQYAEKYGPFDDELIRSLFTDPFMYFDEKVFQCDSMNGLSDCLKKFYLLVNQGEYSKAKVVLKKIEGVKIPALHEFNFRIMKTTLFFQTNSRREFNREFGRLVRYGKKLDYVQITTLKRLMDRLGFWFEKVPSLPKKLSNQIDNHKNSEFDKNLSKLISEQKNKVDFLSNLQGLVKDYWITEQYSLNPYYLDQIVFSFTGLISDYPNRKYKTALISFLDFLISKKKKSYIYSYLRDWRYRGQIFLFDLSEDQYLVKVDSHSRRFRITKNLAVSYEWWGGVQSPKFTSVDEIEEIDSDFDLGVTASIALLSKGQVSKSRKLYYKLRGISSGRYRKDFMKLLDQGIDFSEGKINSVTSSLEKLKKKKRLPLTTALLLRGIYRKIGEDEKLDKEDNELLEKSVIKAYSTTKEGLLSPIGLFSGIDLPIR